MTLKSTKLNRPIPGYLTGIEFQLAKLDLVKDTRVRVTKSHRLGFLAGQVGTIVSARKITIDKDGVREMQYEGNDGQWTKSDHPVIWLEPVKRETYGICIAAKLDNHPESIWCFYQYDDLEVLDYITV